MAVRNFQRHHLLTCKHMPDDVKTNYAAIKNKAVQSKKDSYIYLAQSCKEMGIIEKGGHLRIGTVEERSKSPVTAERINRPPAAAAASSVPARNGDTNTPVRKNAAASTHGAKVCNLAPLQTQRLKVAAPEQGVGDIPSPSIANHSVLV